MIPFYVEDSMSYKGHKMIVTGAEIDDFIGGPIDGSYNILFARIWGLSPADFLRFVRDKYKATLHGKDDGYITFTFTNIININTFQIETIRRWIVMRDN